MRRRAPKGCDWRPRRRSQDRGLWLIDLQDRAGKLLEATDEEYFCESPSQSHATTRVDGPTHGRELIYDADGWVKKEIREDAITGVREERDLTFDEAGCLVRVDVEARDGSGALQAHRSTSHVCSGDGTRIMRVSEDHMTGTRARVYRIPALGEIRPDLGIILRRANVSGTVVVEEARDLSSGARVASESGYVLNDMRGSVLARTAFDPPGSVVTREGDYDAWGRPLPLSTLDTPRHGFLGEEADPSDDYVHLGRRVYDPSLRRWLSPDPLVLIQPEVDVADGRQLNLYAYASNNPVARLDSSGEIAPLALIVAIVGATLFMESDENADISGALGGVGDAVDAIHVSREFIANPTPRTGAASAVSIGLLLLPGDQPNVGGAMLRHADDAADVVKEVKVTAPKGAANPKVKEALERGQKAHAERQYPPGFKKEEPLPSGKRMDAYKKGDEGDHRVETEQPPGDSTG